MLRNNDAISYILIQGVIFSTTLFLSRLLAIDYGFLLVIAGVLVLMITVPSGIELGSYARAVKEAGRYEHQRLLNHLHTNRTGWLGAYGGMLMGMIPFVTGVIMSL